MNDHHDANDNENNCTDNIRDLPCKTHCNNKRFHDHRSEPGSIGALRGGLCVEAWEPSVDNRPGRSDDDLPEHNLELLVPSSLGLGPINLRV